MSQTTFEKALALAHNDRPRAAIWTLLVVASHELGRQIYWNPEKQKLAIAHNIVDDFEKEAITMMIWRTNIPALVAKARIEGGIPAPLLPPVRGIYRHDYVSDMF